MALWWSPRVGKTLATIEELKWVCPDRGLIVCPLVVAPFWASELEQHGFPTINLYSGTLDASLGALKRISDEAIAIVNYDRLAYLADALLKWDPQAVVGDESHLIKSPSAKRARAFRRLAWRADWVRLLTGTPSPNHYGDAWGQLSALDPNEWGKSFEKFAQQYLIRDSMFPSRILGYRNIDELQQRMLPYVSIVRREDVFGPDTWQIVQRTLDMPKAARIMYDTLGSQWFLKEDQATVSADHVLKRLTRLQQLAAGYLPTDDGELRDVHDAKVNAVMGDLEEIIEANEKAVLFHRFRWEGERYAKELKQRGTTHWRISGDTPTIDRDKIVSSLRDAPRGAVAVVQIQSGGVGISFAEATHALFVSRGFSYSDDQQARDRIYKPGARRVVSYYVMRGTVDEYVASVLASKQDVHKAITNADVEAMAWGRVHA